jgi:putative membrane protein
VRLDPRTIVTRLLTLSAVRNQIGLLLSLLAVVGLRGGFRVAGLVAAVLVIGAVIAGRAVVEWLMFSYAVDSGRLVVRRGVLRRSLTVVPLDRIRGVDVHASALHRLLGIAVVRVDAAATGGNRDEAALDAVRRPEAERLRRVLLREIPAGPAVPPGWAVPPPGSPPGRPAPGGPLPAADPAPAAQPGQVLARLRPGWLLYAPLVGSYLLAPVAAFFAAQQALDELRIRWLDRAGWLLGRHGPDPLLVAGAIVAVLAGAVAAAAVTNWGFTLVRRGGALVSERGLLSRRQVSLELARIRGYALVEPLPLRVARAARLLALVTGLGGENSRRGQLLPLGPAMVARQVAATAGLPFASALRRHPPAARRRRLVRAVVPWLLLGVPPALLGLWPAVAAAGVLAAASVPLGLDRYRGLGHALDRAAVSVRSGSLVRRQVVLDRTGVVGWRVRQSFFQRRAGLCTVTVATGAGAGGYDVIDVAAPAAVALMTEVTPREVTAVRETPALGEPALGEPALGEPALGEPALGEPALGEPALGEPAPGEPAPGEPAIGEPALGDDGRPATHTLER